jgi:hypothetical protein
MLGGSDMIPARRGAARLNALSGPSTNWLTVAGADLSGVVAAIVITMVLGRASRGKDSWTGSAPDSARAVRVRATIPSARQSQHLSVRRVKPESFRVTSSIEYLLVSLLVRKYLRRSLRKVLLLSSRVIHAYAGRSKRVGRNK